MDSAQLGQLISEYYDPFKRKEIQDLLNSHGGVLLAKVGNHPPWPARYTDLGEFIKMIRYRQKRTQVCVYFFGSRNYGWVFRNALQPFRESLPLNSKALKKHGLQQKYEDALSEARSVLHTQDESAKRFYDRLQEQRSKLLETTCSVCNRLSENSLLILCDGDNCDKEYHMDCLIPPLKEIPAGKWFCPRCRSLSGHRVDSPRNTVKWTLNSEMIGTPMSLCAYNDSLLSNTGLKREKGAGDLSKRKLSSTGIQEFLRPMPVQEEAMVMSALVKRVRSESVGNAEPLLGKHDGRALRERSSSPAHTQLPFFLSSHAAAVPNPHGDSNREERDSDERCFICGLGGEVVICDAPSCCKVYHQFCLGDFPFPRKADAIWRCPRHTCALTRISEFDDREISKVESTPRLPSEVDGPNKDKSAPQRRVLSKRTLWKCNKCPLALSDEALPPLLPAQIHSKKSRSFVCPYCGNDAPLRVQLAKLLERVWSNLATNHQGYPFCGPLLHGLQDITQKHPSENSRMDLFQILRKIRTLQYETSSAFVRDIDRIVQEALELIHGRSLPLIESATSLKIVSTEHMMNLRHRIDTVERKQRHLSQKDREEVSAADTWPIPWRKECSGDEYWTRLLGPAQYVEPRSLEEWTAFVCKAPMYAGIFKTGKNDKNTADNALGLRVAQHSHRQSSADDSYSSYRLANQDSRCDPALTAPDGSDIIKALASLSKCKTEGSETLHLGTQLGNSIQEEVTDKEFFLSPSTTEIQDMFQQQSKLLRHALEAHAVLQKMFALNNQEILALDQERGGLTVGEGRLAAELRLANKNLKARLLQKDCLLERITSEHARLRQDYAQLGEDLKLIRKENKMLKENMGKSGTVPESKQLAPREV